MYVKSGRASRRKGCSKPVSDEAGFADARRDDLATAVLNKENRLAGITILT